MNQKAEKVIILNYKCERVAKYDSVKDVAREYNCSIDTVRRYIYSGNFWKQKKVYLDFAID